jgi:hypothetical protein
MNKMNDEKCESPKRTLVGARMNLQSKNGTLAGLARMSETLMEKFERTEGQIKKGLVCETKEKKQPDLIGMFDETADEMQTYINRIGNALERALNFVD